VVRRFRRHSDAPGLNGGDDSNRQLIFGSQGNERQKGIIVLGLFVSGGRNAERGMIALRVQDPTARHEEASNDNTVLRPSGSHKPGEQSYRSNDSRCPGDMFLIDTE
jgi:hypothetical protein